MKFIKHIVVALLPGLFSVTAIAQTPVAPTKYVVVFRDKNNSPYSISNPSQYLSAKAIERRNRYGISIDERDLPVNPAYITGVQNTGVFVLNRSKWLNCITIWAPDSTVLPTIAALPYVQSVGAIAKRKAVESNPIKDMPTGKPLKERPAPNTPKDGSNAPLDYGLGNNQITMLHGEYLHNNGYKGEGMTVAVLDAGFSSVNQMDIFDSLFVYNRIIGTRDFVNPGNTDVYQFATHGTYVLSCMAGNIPGQLVGTAPRANYWLLRSEENNSENIIEEYNWSSAAEFADSVGVDVINSSLGYTQFDDSTMNHTYADMNGDKTPSTRAADVAAAKGIMVVNSAGNSGSGAWFYIGAPADADSILTVGAVDSLGLYVNFSSKGPSFDKRIKPNVCARGRNAWVANTAGGVMPGSGTSFSSPIMAGAVTCFWQANPTYNNMQIIDAIQKSANQANNPDSLMGYGIPDFSTAHQFLPAIETSTNNKPTDNDEIVNIFPNPFTNTFNIVYRSGNNKEIDVTVTDIKGKKVFTAKYPVIPNAANTIVLSSLENAPKGQYVVTVKGNGKKPVAKKVIKD